MTTKRIPPCYGFYNPAPGDLASRIAKALELYAQRGGTQPQVIYIHESVVSHACELLKNTGIAVLPGVHPGHIWIAPPPPRQEEP